MQRLLDRTQRAMAPPRWNPKRYHCGDLDKRWQASCINKSLDAPDENGQDTNEGFVLW